MSILAPGRTRSRLVDGTHKLRGQAQARKETDDHHRAGRSGAAARRRGVLARRKLAMRLAGEGDWNGFCVLHTAAARVGGLDRASPAGQGRRRAGMRGRRRRSVYLLGADEIDFPKKTAGFDRLSGHHGDRGAHRADVILPARPTPRNRAPTSTPRAGCRWPAARPSRRARRRRTGRSCARCRSVLGKLPYDSLSRHCAKRCYAAIPAFCRRSTCQQSRPNCRNCRRKRAR
jgi:NADH-quinone oxidoreductase subunit G